MAKLLSMMLLLVAIQFVLLLYVNPTAEDTDLWTAVSNPTNWGSKEFLLAIIGISAGAAAVAAIVTSAIGVKSDLLIFAGAVVGFLSIGVILRTLGVWMQAQLTTIFCGDVFAGTCSPANFVTWGSVGVIGFYYIFTVVEWWRLKDF